MKIKIISLGAVCLSLLCAGCGMPVYPSFDQAATDSNALDKQSLRLSAHTVVGAWEEADMFISDIQQWTGSAGVVGKKKGRLYLVSNSHCLGLAELTMADDATDFVPDIQSYGLAVQFASGQQRDVLRFADQLGTLDLSLLEVDARGLKEGRDYVFLPYKSLDIDIGDDVVAVGSPFGLAGTHTFGKISALRGPASGQAFRAIQTDAAINHGNSGGPLFVKKREKYYWIGVNTWGFDGANNLGFAIDAEDAVKSDYKWYTANAQGAAQAIGELYRR